MEMAIQKDFPMYEREFEDMFDFTKEHVMNCIFVLLLFLVICGILSTLVLTTVSRDKR